jgi:formylglycine-generating enzyme required for sulfatase activity
VCSVDVCAAPPSCGGTAAAINQLCKGADGQPVSCCTSPVVAGGTFFRNYDGFSYKDMSHKATVASFRLDRFEVTVGRYREFVKALTSASYRPADQSGRHKHLPGEGLTDISNNNAPEYGWRAAWNDKVSTANLTCPKDPDHPPTWTSVSGADENKPITCVNWYDAYAFCIWDEGFLPSDTEWNYAAAGGADNRKYPWSGQTVDCDRAVYSPAADPVANPDLPGVNPCTSTYFPSDVGSKPKGDGKYLQADLAGNVSELVLDADGSLPGMCSNCVRGDNIQFHLRRGGSGWNADARQLSSFSIQFPETGSDQAEGTADIGFRCARPAAP